MKNEPIGILHSGTVRGTWLNGDLKNREGHQWRRWYKCICSETLYPLPEECYAVSLREIVEDIANQKK